MKKILLFILILIGLYAVLEVAGRVLLDLWMRHEIEVLSERMKDEPYAFGMKVKVCDMPKNTICITNGKEAIKLINIGEDER